VISVQTWTGKEAHALRTALRYSQRDFAERTGIAERTLAIWDRRLAAITPRPELQRILDTTLAQAPTDAKVRFAALLAPHEDATPAAQATLPEPVSTAPVGPAAHVSLLPEVGRHVRGLVIARRRGSDGSGGNRLGEGGLCGWGRILVWRE
jgi:transcriptional regulator with XRE-family HTH domain